MWGGYKKEQGVHTQVFLIHQVAFLNLPVENYPWSCCSLISSAEEAACELNEKGELSVGRRGRGNSAFV